MRDKIFLLAPLSTLVLAVAFLAPSSPRSKTAYESLKGRAWSMRPADPEPVPAVTAVAVSSAAAVAAREPAAAPTPRPARAHAYRPPRSIASRKAVAVQPVSVESHPSAVPAISSGTAVPSASAPQAVRATPPDYALEDIADRFEADESKFPLDRSIESGGESLHLVGLEKLPKMFVLKVAVVNAADADFFIKAFAVTAGDQILSSRSIFRILVEPQRTREGYVLFERPQAGASVRISLKEDGGKGRTLETAIPYSF